MLLPAACNVRPVEPSSLAHTFYARHRNQRRRNKVDGRAGGISLGGILVIVGIVLAILLGHWWIGLIIALVGLVFFGGFAKGKWY